MPMRHRSIFGFIAFLLAPVFYVFDIAVAALRNAFEQAFPVEVARQRLEIGDHPGEPVIYGVALARIRAFRSRLAQRDRERVGIGGLAFSPAL